VATSQTDYEEGKAHLPHSAPLAIAFDQIRFIQALFSGTGGQSLPYIFCHAERNINEQRP
jgi:hypothetical protein